MHGDVPTDLDGDGIDGNDLAGRNDIQMVLKLTDLLPLCANCHRMIHRKNDNVLSREHLSELIKISRKNVQG
jgi:predicted HNH restriction endonuclease